MVYVRLEQEWTDAGGATHAAGAMVDVDAATLATLEAQGVVAEAEGGDDPDGVWTGPTGGDDPDGVWTGPTGGGEGTDGVWTGPTGGAGGAG